MSLIAKGHYYEFHRERVISRPGAELKTRTDLEIGPEISKEAALARVIGGKNVYTLAKEDAYKLARSAAPGRTIEEVTSPHEDVYFRHFHPGGLHPNEPGNPGHVFFGDRGERFQKDKSQLS